MPIQHPITQDSGAVASYHVVMNTVANNDTPMNGNVVINSYFDEAHKDATPLGSLSLDISLLVQAPLQSSLSWFDAVEKYLLTTAVFAGGLQVS